MTTTQIIFIIAITIVLVLAVGGIRRGPRVTQIDRTVHRSKDNKDV